MAFNLEDYETVEERLEKFHKDFPDFRIETQLVTSTPSRFIVQAWIYRTYADAVPFSSGLAFEDISERGVNATSALENAETSAIGRALASAGYAAKGKRPSRTEMSKVQNKWEKKVSEFIPVEKPSDPWTIEQKEMPMPVADAVTALNDGIKPEEIPYCKHGQRKTMQGVGKTGKPFYGYVCQMRDRAEQCPAIWCEKDKTGRWVVPKPVAETGELQ